MAERIEISSTDAARILLIAISLLLLGNLIAVTSIHGLDHDVVYGLVPLLYMDAETNVPTLFTVILMVAAALLLGLTSYLQTEGKVERFRWRLLAVVFLILAVDEFASLHERLTVPLRSSLDTGGVFYFAWIIPYLVVVLVLGVYYLPWLLRLNRQVKAWMIASAILYLSGAVGMEAVGGLYLEQNEDQRDLFWSVLVTIEELLEMLGLSAFIFAILRHIEVNFGAVSLEIGASGSGDQ